MGVPATFARDMYSEYSPIRVIFTNKHYVNNFISK
jgi:hypothetical protein